MFLAGGFLFIGSFFSQSHMRDPIPTIYVQIELNSFYIERQEPLHCVSFCMVLVARQQLIRLRFGAVQLY